MEMKLIAHRAGTDRCPEQSMQAAAYSLSRGADLVELDVRFTRDAAPVICHDPNALRLFGVDREIQTMELPEFLTLRNRSDMEIAAYTLDAAFQAGLVPALLHLKCDAQQLTAVLERVARFHFQERVVLGLGDPQAVQTIKRFDPRIRVLAFMHQEADMDAFLASACEYVRLWEPWVTQEKIERIHSFGKEVWIMSGTPETVGYTELSNLKKWEAMGADAVLINEIEKAQDALGREGTR